MLSQIKIRFWDFKILVDLVGKKEKNFAGRCKGCARLWILGRQHHPQPWIVQSLVGDRQTGPPAQPQCCVVCDLTGVMYKVLYGSTEEGSILSRENGNIHRGGDTEEAWHLREWGLVPWGQGRGSQTEWYCRSKGHLKRRVGVFWVDSITREHYGLPYSVGGGKGNQGR